MDKITYKLENYEGPLDLLYALIQKNEIDIYDIPISLVADQFIEVLSNYKKADNYSMELISEFVSLAATLLEIKSQMLLPKQSKKQEIEIDPREQLVNRLIAYEKVKIASEFLRQKELGGFETFYKQPESEYKNYVSPKGTTKDYLGNLPIELLYSVFNQVLKRKELKTDKIRSSFNSVSKDFFTISEKINYIRAILKINGKVNFTELLINCGYKSEAVITFLAALELIKEPNIGVRQISLFENIEIYEMRKDTYD